MSPTPFLRRPRLRSLEGAESGRRVTWLELFFDLVFVAAVSQVGSPLATDYTVAGLCRYALFFLLIWWAWMGATTFATRFDTDDGVQRMLTVVQAFLVAVMAINAKSGLTTSDSAGFGAAYAVMRFTLALQYLRAARIASTRPLTTHYAAGIGTAACLWLAAAFTTDGWRLAIWAVALAVDVATPLVAEAHSVRVPPDAAHLPERFGLFTLILLGESVVAIMHGMESQADWTAAAAGSAFTSMTLAFLLWWWYFDGIEGPAERPTRTVRESWLFRAWTYLHFPLYLGTALTGVGLEHLVRAADDGPLHAGDGTLLCVALATVMLSMVAIAGTHPDAPGGRRWPWHLVPHVALAGTACATATVVTRVEPVWLVLWLWALTLAQAGVTVLVSGSGAAGDAPRRSSPLRDDDGAHVPVDGPGELVR